MKIIERDNNLHALTETLAKMRADEKIPAPRQREVIRARLMELAVPLNLAAFETPLGWIAIVYSERGIVALKLPRPSRKQAIDELRHDYPNASRVDQAPVQMIRELQEYMEGRRRQFDLPLDWSAIKPFQREVLEAANRIPFGETRSYGWIARQIGKPGAARAVGRALGANPIPIILPCHRVIGSDGGLHGYGGGLPLKRKLLQLEGVAC